MKTVDVAIAVIVRDGKILICQRKEKDTFGGYWEFPGGKCDPGETLEHCLARELMEELQLTAKVIDKLTPVEHEYPKLLLTLHPFLCEFVAGEPKLIECQRIEWVEPARLVEFTFPPANETLLEEIIRRVAPK